MSHSVDLPSTAYIKFLAFAGGPAEDSYLKHVDNNAVIVVGEQGGDAGSYDGGAGYSGGGAYGGNNDGSCDGGGDGGSAGSDGEDGDASCEKHGAGGDGSDLDVATLNLLNFILSAGEGGVTSGRYAGGAGGILVDDIGPTRPDYQTGEGYGGGGYYYSDPNGLPGVILLDFVAEE